MSSYFIAEYDPAWPGLAREEMALVAKWMGINTKHLEHVGSTAVPGLGAKPIIDLMAGIPSFPRITDPEPLLAPLRAIGYEFNGTETVPGTLYIRKAGPPRFNLHMTEYQGTFWKDHLLFRDYLRTHPGTAGEYGKLKRDLLARLGPDPDKAAYNAGKGPFIDSILALARFPPLPSPAPDT